MPADFIIKAGDTQPQFSQQLSYSDQSPVNLYGATIVLAVRSMTSSAPIILSGTVTGTSSGVVTYQPVTGDTAGKAGSYIGSWVVTFGSGDQQTFPTDGYLSIEIEPAVTDPEAQQLVSLQQVKAYPGISIQPDDHKLDARLAQFIEAARPLIEQITGPIIPAVYDEWHSGGQTYIMLRRRPSSGFGTTPVVTLIACSEYNGPIEWPLSVVASPDQGQTYSVELDSRLGQVVRRTAGGGVQAFPPGPQAVHVVYEAGQSTVPANVQEATLELIRVNYQTTMAVGTGRRTPTDTDDTGPPLGFFMPRRVRELLGPMRRHPSVA